MKNIKKTSLIAGVSLMALLACSQQSNSAFTESGLDPQNYKSEFNGKLTELFVLKNANNMEVAITNFGGRIVSIMVPDKNGDLQDVVLGFDNVANYEDTIKTPSDFGAAIGRYANRINKGIIVIDGDSIQLPTNNFGHCLHGGPQGWQYQVYEPKMVNDSTLTMTMNSADGDAAFPGAVTAIVTYTLKSDNSIDIDYEATTTKKTVINMTNHCYFNLSGNPEKPVTDQVMYINADSYTPVDSTFMTTGEIASVEGTPLDFRQPTEIGKNVTNFANEQIKNANGFDHNWCMNTKGDDSQIAATAYCPATGIQLDVYTNEPGIQFYSGNFLDGSVTGKKGIVYNQHAGFCLETQKYPDSPNKSNWPSPFLSPGETYHSHCVYKFSVKK